MAGHSQFKNIMHRKGAQDARRAKAFTKLIREIITATRTGQPDPVFNPRLRGAIAAAKALNMPKDKIEGAIKKGAQPNDGENYEEICYEGYAPGGIALIVEALTDNRNRTASEVRAAFTKHGGTLGETGSVNYLFDRVGLIFYPLEIGNFEKVFEVALEAGASDCIEMEEGYEILCQPTEIHEVRDKLVLSLGDPMAAKLIWRPHALINVQGDNAEKLSKIVAALEESDDVQTVSGNYELND